MRIAAAMRPARSLHWLLDLGHHRLVQQVVAGDGRLVPAVARDLGPQAHEALLQVGARPQRLAGAQRLEAARRHVHVEHQIDPVLLGPGDVVGQPLPAVVEVLAGRGVRLERSVVHVEANRVHAHRGDALVVGLVVVAARQAHVAPDLVAEGDAAQSDGVAAAVDDLRAAHAQERRRRGRGRGRERRAEEQHRAQNPKLPESSGPHGCHPTLLSITRRGLWRG